MKMNGKESDYETKRKEWSRGETPEDIKTRCLSLCSKYLAGIWREMNENELIVWRITGGFTNQLYYCGLPLHCKTIDAKPREVAIKFYGQKWIESNEPNERLNDIIVYLLASHQGLGPKQFAFFSGGNIEEYVKSHFFGLKEQTDAKCVDKISRLLARFHSMDVPVARNEHWFSHFLDNFYTKSYDLFPLTEMFQEVNATTFLSINLKDEINWLKKCLMTTNSPVVFAHIDFRGPNIMVRDNVSQDMDQSNDIILCDFEYSTYSYRGFDFGAIFEDWGRTDAEEVGEYVTDDVFKQFMISYLDECVRIHGDNYLDNSVNTIDHLVKEAKIFLLFQQMFFIVVCISAEKGPYNKTKKQLLQRADQRLKHYLLLKSKYIKQGFVSI